MLFTPGPPKNHTPKLDIIKKIIGPKKLKNKKLLNLFVERDFLDISVINMSEK